MKKRILFINNSLHGGGAERILQTILNNLDPQKYDLTLYSLHKEELDSNYPQHIKYKYIFEHSSNTDSFLKRFWLLLKNKIKITIYNYFPASIFYNLFIAGKYDTEIAFLEGYSTKIISGSTNIKSRKIAWVHTDLILNHWTKIAFKNQKEEKECYNKFNNVLCVSDSVRSSFIKLFNDSSNVNVCYNPINDQRIKELANQPCNFNKWLDSELAIVTMGRLVEEKGYDRLLPIVYKLKKEGFQFTLNILGEGKERNLLESYIKDHHLEDTVSLIGYCENPYPFLKKGDLFVCSSRSEGYSTVIAEALILGIPVITTECAGMKELLDNGKYGIITENSEEKLYYGLKKLLEDKNQISEYKKLAETRGKYFSLENLMKPINVLLSN